MKKREIMKETNRANNETKKTEVLYQRTALGQNHSKGTLSACRQIDDIKAFAQAQGAQVVVSLADSSVPRSEKNVQKGKQ